MKLDGNPFKSMRVFLTGAGGYLGGVLLDHLAQVPEIEQITGIDVAEPKRSIPAKVNYVQMDIRSPELTAAMAGHDVLVHTAFVVHWPGKMSAAERDDINLNGTRNVANAALVNQVGRFVHASSVAAGDVELARGRTELTEAFPIGQGDSFFYYANGKAQSERLIADLLLSSPITLTCLRPCFITGPYNADNIIFLRDRGLRFRGHDPRVQYIHEDDVATAFARAVVADLPGTYIVAPDDWLRWNEMLQIVGNRSPRSVPVWLARLATGIGWRFLGMGTHPSWIDATLIDFTASNAKLKATGWRPHYNCEKALRDALRQAEAAPSIRALD